MKELRLGYVRLPTSSIHIDGGDETRVKTNGGNLVLSVRAHTHLPTRIPSDVCDAVRIKHLVGIPSDNRLAIVIRKDYPRAGDSVVDFKTFVSLPSSVGDVYEGSVRVSSKIGMSHPEFVSAFEVETG